MAYKYNVFLLIFSLIYILLFSHSKAGVIEGTVYDADSGEPIPVVSIRVEGTGQSMATNDDGRYRLRLDPGQYSLKFSHIAHYSETIEVTVSDSTIIKDRHLPRGGQTPTKPTCFPTNGQNSHA